MFKLVGGDYGGKMIDMSLVPEDSLVISAGIGEDISFDTALIKEKNCKVIGLDPTEKSIEFVKNNSLEGFRLYEMALATVSDEYIKLFKNSNPKHVSESVLSHHRAVKNSEYHYVKTISLKDLLEKNERRVSIIKMDIEGMEYCIFNDKDTLNCMKEHAVPQLICEFHHFCSDYTLEDTKQCIQNLKDIGYEFYIPKKTDQPLAELTFVHESCL